MPCMGKIEVTNLNEGEIELIQVCPLSSQRSLIRRNFNSDTNDEVPNALKTNRFDQK